MSIENLGKLAALVRSERDALLARWRDQLERRSVRAWAGRAPEFTSPAA